VYGVTNYTATVPGGSNPNLGYPAADAQSMITVLKGDGYKIFQARWVDASSQVFVQDTATHTTPFHSGAIGTPTITGGTISDPGADVADAPTRANIEADILALAAVTGKNDTVVVYFSGHGTQDTSVSPTREYFDPYQSVLYFTAYNNFYANPPTAVQDDELRSYLDAISTPRKVLILDTCNSGGFIGNQLEADWTPPSIANNIAFVSPATLIAAVSNYAGMTSSPTGLSPYGTAQVLSAAGRDELSYETSSYGHGVMTYWLLQGLSGPADLNHDGHITVLEAYAYAKAGVDQNWNPAVGSASSFEPHVSGGPVDFELF